MFGMPNQKKTLVFVISLRCGSQVCVDEGICTGVATSPPFSDLASFPPSPVSSSSTPHTPPSQRITHSSYHRSSRIVPLLPCVCVNTLWQPGGRGRGHTGAKCPTTTTPQLTFVFCSLSLTSIEAMLVRNYDPATRAAKKNIKFMTTKANGWLCSFHDLCTNIDGDHWSSIQS